MEEQLRRLIVRYSHLVYEKGWVANHDGNLSARVGEGRFVATPTALSKADVGLENLIVVGADGTRLEGGRKIFSEWSLHRVAYALRTDIGAVIHAHPPTATGFAVSGIGLGAPFMAEPVVSIGAEIPTVPYFLPGDSAIDAALAEALGRAHVVLLGGHGVLAVGPDLETAFLRMELVEHMARIALVARTLGGPQPLPAEHVGKLLEKRRAAGLEPAGMAAAVPSSEAPAVAFVEPEIPTGAARSIVAEALRRLHG